MALDTAEAPRLHGVCPKQIKFGTVKDLFEFVIRCMDEEGKSSENNRLYLLDAPHAAVHFLGPDTLARNVRPADATAWLREIHKRGVKTTHPRAYLSAAFGRGIAADNDPTKEIEGTLFGIEGNPVTAVGGRVSSNARDRKLSLEEVKIFWDEFPGYASPAIVAAARMIIAMGGIRVTEVINSKKDWWHEKRTTPLLRIPKTKNDTTHDLPLTAHAISILKEAKASSHPDSEYLFQHTTEPLEPVTPNAVAKAVRKFCDETEFERFQPRDLRRTMKSHLLDHEDDLREEWIDIWHNHGQNASVARKHYDRAEYRRVKSKVAAAVDDILINAHS
nr:tyrosine-type recombinase/integrase [Parvularcula sp. IMCC14364]